MFEFLDPFFAATASFFKAILDFFISTKIPAQIDKIDYKGLFSNGWFMVPYIAMLAWNVYKQAINSIIIIVLLSGCWAFFGTPYMQAIMAQDEIPLNAILPLVAGACAVFGFIIYRIFFKSD
ncbi:MAG: hypothetical protein KAS94_14445 [Desulfobulbaceae bacterium]|nr:hypothetical protein [Desulfobulbaceae bacterium]